MNTAALNEVEKLVNSWSQDPNHTKQCFLTLEKHLEAFDNVRLSLVSRPNVSYSLRAAHTSQGKDDLFAMVDVIDDDPADRWLSVCFYGDMVSDPEQLANEVPEGLKGRDAKCFDIYELDEELVSYVETRLTEAFKAVSGPNN